MAQTLEQPRAGRYKGRVETWLDPTGEPDRSTLEGTLSEFIPGRWDFRYTWTFQGEQHTGRMTFGYDDSQARYWSVWLDSFHTPAEPMLSVGEKGGLSLLGQYAAGPQTWGWRTTLSDGLLEMANITPDGQECPAVRVELSFIG